MEFLLSEQGLRVEHEEPEKHTWLPLKYDQEYDVYLYLYTGMKGGHFEVNAFLETVDLNTEGLYYDIHVPYQCMLEVGEESYDYIKIRDCLDKALLRPR